MTDFLKRVGFFVLACVAMNSCSKIDVLDVIGPDSEEASVTIRVDVAAWGGETRAEGDALEPITILVTNAGENTIEKKVKLEEGSDFSITLPTGDYDLFAVCGLDGALIGSELSDVIAVSGGADFAVGKTTISVSGGKSTPEELTIAAQRQTAWLELALEGVPENIASVRLYAKGLSDCYALDRSWFSSANAAKRYTPIPLVKDNGVYTASLKLAPSIVNTPVTYFLEATTESGNTTLLTTSSAKLLVKGVRLSQTLTYSGMTVVEGGVSIGGWSEDEDEKDIEDACSFSVGEQYFSLPATVIKASSAQLLLLGHKPLTVTLDDVRQWESYSNISYTLAPEVNAKSWALPTTLYEPNKVINCIAMTGWDEINAQFAISGSTPINREATNIIAYYDQEEDCFYSFDFGGQTVMQIADETGEFLLYPIGTISLAR